MTRRLPALLALLALAAVPLSLPHAAASAEDGAEAFTVSDAVFRWGINDESNNNAFAPGTYNFPGAGKAPDPGRGGQVLDGRARWPSTGALAWRASDGKVRIEKVTSSGPVLATYAGLRTGPDGQPLGGPTVEVFSGHQVVIAGGTGTVDPAAGTATIRWKGSFTVFYYSGMTFFSVTDPVLEVTPTSARITATGSGHASSMEDMTKWSPIPATTVTLAETRRRRRRGPPRREGLHRTDPLPRRALRRPRLRHPAGPHGPRLGRRPGRPARLPGEDRHGVLLVLLRWQRRPLQGHQAGEHQAGTRGPPSSRGSRRRPRRHRLRNPRTPPARSPRRRASRPRRPLGPRRPPPSSPPHRPCRSSSPWTRPRPSRPALRRRTSRRWRTPSPPPPHPAGPTRPTAGGSGRSDSSCCSGRSESPCSTPS
ncbi:hypothetical protein G5V59_23725 [Nocardioides sp. W3-2-3]|uniref:hypothetical protein n=1 Tax=Nocardioides convexus TaxID=2712224 RepID=UPI0024188384|nr:hypothetical protein [Nocardioides convexus]NHA01711.1 hypothetical protein [Nocardioides convexus]